jgi:exopolysaccharide production protein ExoF
MMTGSSKLKALALVLVLAAWGAPLHGRSAADTAAAAPATQPGAGGEPGLTVALLSDRSPAPGACKEDGESGTMRGSDLSAAAKLFIKFSGLPDLTGEYRVDPMGDISVPVMGHVNVASTCVAALEQMLGKGVSALTRREVFAAVEISEYRPVFVTGYVMRPGALPWRPGMSILQSVAEAGGLFRAVTSDGGTLLAQDVVSRWQQAVTSQKLNLALLARYEAMRSGANTIEVPSKLRELVGSDEAKDLISAQITQLVDANRDYNARLEALKTENETSNAMSRELATRIERLSSNLEIRRKYKKTLDDMQSKGMIRLERAMGEFTQIVDLEERLSTAKLELDRSRARIAKLQRDEVEIRDLRKRQLESDTAKVERDIARLDIEINSARETYLQMTGKVPAAQEKKSGRERMGLTRYKIVRQVGGKPTTVATDELAPMRPGDVLVVSVE